MNKVFSRILSFGLCAAVLTSVGAVNAAAEIPKSDRAPVVIPIELDRRPLDANGRIFTFLGSENVPVHDVFSDELNGEMLNDAIYERNLRTEEMHNVRIEEVRAPDVLKMARNATFAADNFFDALTASVTDNIQLAYQGMLLDLGTLDKIDLDAQWWSSPLNDETALLWRNYFAAGDILVSDNNAAHLIVYNRGLLERFGIEDDYAEMAFDGLWTDEEFDELMMNSTYDIDGDAVLSHKSGDIIGVTSGAEFSGVLGAANRVKSVTVNCESGLLRLWSAKTPANLTELLTHIEKWGLGWQGEDAYDIFVGGNSAMYIANVGELSSLYADADFEVGILPLPKTDARQSVYRSYVDPSAALTLSVTVMASDLEVTGTVLDTMAQASYKYLTPRYYEIITQNDDEAAKMLDIIFNGMTVRLDEAIGVEVTEDNAEAAASAVKKLNKALAALRKRG